MKQLQLTAEFDSFASLFQIDSEIVLKTYNSADRFEILIDDYCLYLKRFDHLEHKNLLLSTSKNQGQDFFAFAYWIPSELVEPTFDLLLILELFANMFGCQVKVGSSIGKFIKKELKVIDIKFESPNQIIEVYNSHLIPNKCYFYLKSKLVGQINWVECYYCFAVNQNRYLTWLLNIKTTTRLIKKEDHQYLENFIDCLDPIGRTKIEILSSKTGKQNSLTDGDSQGSKIEVEIPHGYDGLFVHILSILETGKEFLIIPKINKDSCLFCGSFDTNTEHIYPIWFRKYFKEKKITPAVFSSGDRIPNLNLAMSKHTESTYGFTTEKICYNCNNDWMSKLEDKAKKILTIDEKNLKKNIASLDLTKDDTWQLSRWIIVKSLLIALKMQMPIVIPQEIVENLKTSNISSDFLVEILDSELYDLDFYLITGSSAAYSKIIPKENLKRLSRSLVTWVWKVGNFIFRVTYFDNSLPLMRQGLVKRFKVLFPLNFNLPYLVIDNETEMWGSVEQNIQLPYLAATIRLVDKI